MAEVRPDIADFHAQHCTGWLLRGHKAQVRTRDRLVLSPRTLVAITRAVLYLEFTFQQREHR